MKSILTNMPGKSLLFFMLSLFGSWYRATSLTNLKQFDQTPLGLDLKNGFVIDFAGISGLEIFSCFLWFLSILLILEAISLAFTLIRRRPEIIERRSCTFFIKHYAKVLYPIYFGLELFRESKLIIRELDKKIAQEMGNKSKAQIVAYFTSSDSDKIDRVKLIKAIEDTATEIREKTNINLNVIPLS